MKDIVEAIKERRATIGRLQEELKALERALALLNGSSTDEPKTHQVAAGEKLSVRERVGVKRGHPLKGRFNPKSGVGHTVVILREAGVPLHVDEILARVRTRGREAKKGSLASTLAKLSKQGKVFFRASQPNTFGLLEWKKAEASAQA